MAKNWYPLRTYTDREFDVKEAIEARLDGADAQAYFGKILVPTERLSEIKSGKKRVFERKIFPGYILMEMEFNDTTQLFLEDVPNLAGFIDSSGSAPVPMAPDEIARIEADMDFQAEKAKPKATFEVSDNVRIMEGSFENYEGSVESIDHDKGTMTVMVPIFGRSTPVELEFWQVEKF